MLSSRFKIILDHSRKHSKPFHQLLECLLCRSFWNGKDGIPPKWDRFLSRSIEECPRTSSSNWETCSSRSNIIHRNRKTCSLPFSTSRNAFSWLRNHFWQNRMRSRSFHKFDERILLHWERILKSSDCVSQHSQIQGGPKVTIPRKKFEYLRYMLTKWVHFFTTDKGVFIGHIHKRNIDKHCFEVSSLIAIKNCNRSRVMKSHIAAFSTNSHCFYG